ncbi:alpha-mannosidase [Paenibacillus turicensis]|uniref:Alpha-mannosidase n=1 Tax=Paenibacillus turicensis TaxID=160487 RepID=A0ABS4FLX3_9BACL|nr:glycoside hydrolase family 38 C-terminal domain-containing protein [Paenibacillus turicensis]MBP1903581.1 alpha-mannosidase [Paenibacillus turicensis]
MERLKRFITELEEKQWLARQELRDWNITHTVYHLPGQYDDEAPYIDGDNYDLFPSVQGTTYFFRNTVELPKAWEGGHIGLIFKSGGEGLLRINGQSKQGLDRNHTFATLAQGKSKASEQVFDQPLELEIELYDPIPEPVDPLNHQAVIQPPIRRIHSELVLVNKAVQSLLYTVIVVRDSAVLLTQHDMRRTRMLEALYQAMDSWIGLSDAEIEAGSSVRLIEDQLRSLIQAIGSSAEGFIHMIGQSHIDIAWLWPMRETVRKTSRTFSSMHTLMEEYPDFNYAQSQPLLFEFLKNNDPVLYEKVRSRIAEGRWELVGGMWVEPDLNIPSGESLMRQMLYGQHFYREEFQRTSEIEWLPDTFGYCASLPQILKHGGIKYFMTTKLGWNDTNRFPYDLFHWVGIDGTAMLSYLNHGVNENTTPEDVDTHWQSYREKNVHNEQMLLYGHGDGGGGVTREMLEYIERSELMVGQPASTYSTASAFFHGITEAKPQLPIWQGDLYLELHRGTYTTHSRNKRSNRQAEVLYREAEMWQVMASVHMEEELARQQQQNLQQGWKLILQNQFHDIIPGSAITESYETSTQEYKQVMEIGESVLNAAMEQVAVEVVEQASNSVFLMQSGEELQSYLIFNSLGWGRDLVVDIPLSHLIEHKEQQQIVVYDEQGKLSDGYIQTISTKGSAVAKVYVQNVPAFGYKTIWIGTAGLDRIPSKQDTLTLGDCWETEYYHITFNNLGEITSLYDKVAQREIVVRGERANRFYFFHDRPTLWDAWDIDDRYEKQPAGEVILLDKQVITTGSIQDVLRFHWRIGDSEIIQDMILYHHDSKIDFKTHVKWNEAHKLLKVGFPIDVVTTKATYEIPFGALERPTHRNTSWEQAQYEVCGHRFVDVSEHDYGVSLLNDCKYGYDVQGSTIRLSLLRAPKWPDATADLGEHEFTYSLYPHKGDWRTAHTLRKAMELNQQSFVSAAYRIGNEEGTTVKANDVFGSGSLIDFNSNYVIVDTIKPTEDGKGCVIRLYESAGGREKISLMWKQQTYASAWLSNALEDELEELESDNNRTLHLQFAPYEIKSIRLNWGGGKSSGEI